jgi:hypothetical protein
LKGSAITAEDAAKNPQAVLDVLEFYTEQTKREAEEYGSSNLQSTVERLSDDKWANLIQDNHTPARPAPPRPAPPPPNARRNDMNDMMDDLAIRSVMYIIFNYLLIISYINLFCVNILYFCYNYNSQNHQKRLIHLVTVHLLHL